MNFTRNILITGGAGFIGSHVVRLFVNKYPEYHIINLDKLTYAGNLANLKDVENQPNYTFVKADICDFDKILELFKLYHIDGVIHLAAESHVDRSIKDPFTFAHTNIIGTLSLLQAARLSWDRRPEGQSRLRGRPGAAPCAARARCACSQRYRRAPAPGPCARAAARHIPRGAGS